MCAMTGQVPVRGGNRDGYIGGLGRELHVLADSTCYNRLPFFGSCINNGAARSRDWCIFGFVMYQLLPASTSFSCSSLVAVQSHAMGPT